ncbi:bifunctional [glutamine synthetase] adenylyltransferase/[glutamine synthetase]-adenylyl-L-tyrosine phosphorylase [Citromicrobium bathyomarinum]|uniref:bifunctional [glutamine synthetase] adenylyltransferase/[glutamine synthetase]-adenylyl-L-tyrosine phosphorylase n=1 Tax=Citromicrobium bathyomarinum TaxID=72174 RepID=UPI003159FD7B
MASEWTDAIARARENAPFLARSLDRLPDLADLLAQGDLDAAFEYAAKAGEGAETGVALRRERLALALTLAIGDLCGVLTLDDVMRRLSSFADIALDRAIAEAARSRTTLESVDGFFAVALGKHGASELNYSSDIDPILLFDPDVLASGPRSGPAETAQRMARDIVRLLADHTEEGYVFRVDLRLRPAAEITPLAVSVNAAATHYESAALAWERAAFIRARSAAGDVVRGENFLASIRPFVWRRSVDFGAIDDIAQLRLRIREAYGGEPVLGPGFDLKRGRGGIREIEFFAQTHQLIHGGRDPRLRSSDTRAALLALARAGIVEEQTARALATAYARLRVAEHRIQMLEDRQTHMVPEGEALERLAHLDGFADGAALLADLDPHLTVTAQAFDTLLETSETGTANDRPARELVAASPLAGQADMGERVAGWLDGRYRALRGTDAQNAFRRLLPALLEALAQSPEPDRAVVRLERLLEALPSGINLFRLLEARPALLDQFLSIITLAPPLANDLALRPALFDALIDRSALDLPESVPALVRSMMRAEPQGNYEALLDRIRVVTGEQRFALGVQLIGGVHDPLDIARGFSTVAEAALQAALAGTLAEFEKAHGRIEGSEMMILGLGRLGGEALTHASDLDIVYLFTGNHAAESDGERPISATRYYNRLAQRVSAAVSVPTAEGPLYEVDTRLRPQGAQGPLAVSVESFARYQNESAWTWEHMALARARVVAGSFAARGTVEDIIRGVLCAPRDPATLRADVLKMRAEMASHKPAKGPLDVKLLRGGLVDIEFILHFLQLRDKVALDPRLSKVCETLVHTGALPEAFAQAHDFLTRLIVAARLLAPDLAVPPGAAGQTLAKACGCDDADALLRHVAKARQEVARVWQQTFEEQLEID